MYKKTVIFVVGLLTTLIFLFFTLNRAFNYFRELSRLNYIFYDASFKALHSKNRSDAIVIVDVDEKSLKFEGRWPWSRGKVANMISVLQNSGAAVIVLDILFPEPERNIAEQLLEYAKKSSDISTVVTDYLSQQSAYFDNDKKLAEILAKSDVVLGEFFNDNLYHSTGDLGKPIITAGIPKNLTIPRSSKFIGNIPILADAVRYTGFSTTIPDEDGIIRRSPLLMEYEQKLYPSLALEAVRSYLLVENIDLELHDFEQSKVFLGVKLGDVNIPTDFLGKVLISYAGPKFSFPYISATDVINNKVPKQSLEGKIVFIGSSAIGIGDLHSTPIQSVDYPGTEIHANIAASILNKNIISSPLWLVGVERIVIVIVGIFFTFFAANFSVLGLLLLTIMMELLLFGLNAVLFVKWFWILPHMMLPYLQIFFLGIVNSGYGYLFETKYRKRIHNIYGQYVSSQHIDKMLEGKGQYTLAGSTKVMSVLFADVSNFTSIAEKLDAKEVKKFLNNLFTPLTEIIFIYKGTIDKYVGDMVMAFWNDPTDDPEHATHGVQTALMMQRKVKELAPIFAEQKLSNIGIRIGVNTGMMHVGDMGSEYRKAYTVLGDAVNLASRLEGANKVYGTGILVSEATKDLCQGIIFRFVDCIYVKGKKLPTKIYEPICLTSDKTAALEEELAQYANAIELYNASSWCQAKEEFAKLVTKYPQVGIYNIYLKRVSGYEVCPPPKDWDLGQHLTEK